MMKFEIGQTVIITCEHFCHLDCRNKIAVITNYSKAFSDYVVRVNGENGVCFLKEHLIRPLGDGKEELE